MKKPWFNLVRFIAAFVPQKLRNNIRASLWTQTKLTSITWIHEILLTSGHIYVSSSISRAVRALAITSAKPTKSKRNARRNVSNLSRTIIHAQTLYKIYSAHFRAEWKNNRPSSNLASRRLSRSNLLWFTKAEVSTYSFMSLSPPTTKSIS